MREDDLTVLALPVGLDSADGEGDVIALVFGELVVFRLKELAQAGWPFDWLVIDVDMTTGGAEK